MSEIRANTVSDAAGTGPATLTGQYAAKAWVNFNGQNTVAIRESGNVSSITDNGTGDYTSNFTNSMTDANYSFTYGAQRSISSAAFMLVATIDKEADINSSFLRVKTSQKDSSSFGDVTSCCIEITR